MMGDCSVGLQQVLRKHNLRLDEGSHILCDAYGASHVYDNVHMQGDVRGDVTQVPHAQLMADVFGAEGDVAGLLQFFAQLQVDRIRSIRQVAAGLQNSRLDDKIIGWGATGKSAWGQNRLCGAPRLRRDRVELDKRHIIHPQAILQPARAANLRLETILAMAQVIVTLHNDMLSAPMKGGFALLNDKVSLALVDKSALFNFGEMARICPWISKQGVLVLDFVFDIGLKNARCVRNARKAQILAREGAIASWAPPDASGRPTNKAAVDWFLMGAEEGTRDMTWEQIEEGADKLRAEGGKTAQIVARTGALVSRAPRDASGRPTNKAAVNWLLMGAEEGTRHMTWEQIEEGADKLRAEGGRCCCLAYGAPPASQLGCPLLNLLPRHVARVLLGAHERPVHCGLVGGLPRGVTWCCADEYPGSRHNLRCLTPFAENASSHCYHLQTLQIYVHTYTYTYT